MKKFTKVNENFENELLRNKLDNNLILKLTIKCDFCSYIDEYKCKNGISDKEEHWLSVETFIQNGWDELVTPEKGGIACPICMDKWKNGKWYDKNSFKN